MEQFRNNTEVAAKVAFRPLRDALAALQTLASSASSPMFGTHPSNQNVLREGGVRVLDFDKGKLNAPVGEFIYQVYKLALCITSASIFLLQRLVCVAGYEALVLNLVPYGHETVRSWTCFRTATSCGQSPKLRKAPMPLLTLSCWPDVPPVLCTFKTLSFPPSCWNALTSGAATVNTAH